MKCNRYILLFFIFIPYLSVNFGLYDPNSIFIFNKVLFTLILNKEMKSLSFVCKIAIGMIFMVNLGAADDTIGHPEGLTAADIRNSYPADQYEAVQPPGRLLI